MLRIYLMVFMPLIVPAVIGVIAGLARKSWTPFLVGAGIGLVAEAAFYFIVLRNMVVQ